MKSMKEIIDESLNAFLRVRSYMRYSTVNQDDGFSIEYQKAEIDDYLERHGMELSNAHIDQALTATKVTGREAFFALVRDVKKGLVDVIIVYKMNRLFRNSEESEYYRNIFRKHKVRLISVTEMIDENTSSGRLQTSILSNIDQYQAEVISDHVRSGLREMAKLCLYTGRPLLLGYELHEEKHGKKKRKRFAVNEKEAALVRRMFQLYADGNSCRKIGKIFKQEGLKTRRGYDFSEQTIRRMLENDFYIGTYRYSVQGYEDIVIENGVPAIIEKELFEYVNEKKASNNPQLQPRYKKRLYALTGKMICGKCGSHYIGTNSQATTREGLTHYNYYTCSDRKEFKTCDGLNVRKEWIENETILKIKSHILNDEKITTLSNEIADLCGNSSTDLNAEIKKLRSQESQIKKKYDKFVAAFLDDDGETESTLAQNTLKALEKDLHDTRKQLHRKTEQLRFSITPESIQTYLETMLNKSTENDIEILKVIFDNFVDKIVVNDDDIEIKLYVHAHERFADKSANALPFVTLSAMLHRIEKYRPKNFT